MRPDDARPEVPSPRAEVRPEASPLAETLPVVADEEVAGFSALAEASAGAVAVFGAAVVLADSSSGNWIERPGGPFFGYEPSTIFDS